MFGAVCALIGTRISACAPRRFATLSPALVCGAAIAWCAACRPIDEVGETSQRSAVVASTGAQVQATGTAAGNEPAQRLPDFVELAQRLSPSVVSVVSTVRIGDDAGKRMRGIGSGLIVSSEGQILTNEHVVRNAARVEVEGMCYNP